MSEQDKGIVFSWFVVLSVGFMCGILVGQCNGKDLACRNVCEARGIEYLRYEQGCVCAAIMPGAKDD